MSCKHLKPRRIPSATLPRPQIPPDAQEISIHEAGDKISCIANDHLDWCILACFLQIQEWQEEIWRDSKAVDAQVSLQSPKKWASQRKWPLLPRGVAQMHHRNLLHSYQRQSKRVSLYWLLCRYAMGWSGRDDRHCLQHSRNGLKALHSTECTKS